METIIRDSNGYININRFEKVKGLVEPEITKIQKKYDDEFYALIASGAKKPIRKSITPYQIKCMLYKVLQDIEKVDNSIGLKLTRQQLLQGFNDFLDLVAWVNGICPFVPSKQIFIAFMGITPTVYNTLLTSGDLEQKEAVETIENAIIDLSLEAGGSGISGEKTIQFRMQAKGSAGHSVSLATPVDNILDKAVNQLSPADYSNVLAGIIGETVKK